MVENNSAILSSSHHTEELDNEEVAVIQTYLNYFRAQYAPYVKSHVSLQILAVPYDKGTVLEVKYVSNAGNSDTIEKDIRPSVADVFKEVGIDVSRDLKKEHQALYEQGLRENALIFSGTCMIGFQDRVFLIKDNGKAQWSEEAARKDIGKLVI